MYTTGSMLLEDAWMMGAEEELSEHQKEMADTMQTENKKHEIQVEVNKFI
jgi:hypothetical protein